MGKIKNAAGSFVLMYVLITLVFLGFTGFKDGYDLTEGDLDDDGNNVFGKLKQVPLKKGINDLTIGIQDLGKLGNPSASVGFDLLGALAISASGTLQIIGGMVTLPFDIWAAIFGNATVEGFYDTLIPPVIEQLIGLLAVLGVGFILLSAKLGFDL